MKVRVIREDGTWIFNKLIDDGTNVLKFESGFGFVAKDQLPAGQTIVKGWA